MPTARDETPIRGIPGSRGIAIGTAVVLEQSPPAVEQYFLPNELVAGEIGRLNLSVYNAIEQIRHLRDRISAAPTTDHIQMLDLHEQMLRDPQFVGEALEIIRAEHINAEWAVRKATVRIRDIFDNLESGYFRERKDDLDSVSERLLRHLAGQSSELGSNIPPNAIIIAQSLSPGDMAELHDKNIGGFATEYGSYTAHTTIIARSLEIPAVVGARSVCSMVQNGTAVIIDGNSGLVVLNPSAETVAQYQAAQDTFVTLCKKLRRNRKERAVTEDGHIIKLLGNLDFVDELAALVDVGGQGVGLLRTEYLFVNRHSLPNEEEQYEHYRSIISAVAPARTTIRTLDIGDDKLTSGSRFPPELRPFQALRAIRYCLKEKAIFRTQLRALLRASIHGRLRIMIPYVSSVDEIREVRLLLAEVKRELTEDGLVYDPDVPLGVMIEIPAAVVLADLLAQEADFFSVGTNDLIQYSLAVARHEEETNHLYQPLHPAMLRTLQHVAEAAKRGGIEVSICGEMAGDPLYTMVLLALGYSELSMAPQHIPLVKHIVRQTRLPECYDLLCSLMAMATVQEVNQFVAERMTTRFPELFLR